ncbi:MAG: serine/threonine protein kinase, partial [bacterium]|nr:serine/threonine protein kinase [bacterium]
MPGTRLGRYVILYRIGGGGMGVVYAAYDPELDRKVALKLLTRQMEPEQAEALTRREAQAMARLAHPNIVTVHDVCTYGDRVFIAMEHLEGQTLRDWLAAAEHSWRKVLEVFLQAGRGLAAAHSADLVHLDFKPGNVMLTGDGGVRVLDFGLAQLDLGGAGSDLSGPAADRETPSITPGPDAIRWIVTDRDAIRGTPAYLAPERIRSGSADARSDQFSFSVALYEALYGERPFAGDTLEDYVDQVHRGMVREPTPANRVPGWLRKALLRGLASEPEDRFASMEEMLQALAPEPRRARNRWLAAVSGLLALGALMTGYLRTLPERVPICAGASERLAGVWDAERKETIRTAFLGTGVAFAGQAFENVAQVLNRYTQDWVGTHTEACEATHVRGEQSERMLDLRMMC